MSLLDHDGDATSDDNNNRSSQHHESSNQFREEEESLESSSMGGTDHFPTGDTDHNRIARADIMEEEESYEDPTSEVEDSDDTESQKTSRRRRSSLPDLEPTQSACLNFAMEHRIFLRAMLSLLAEREKKATEIGMNDPNTIKSGPLKKASHLVSGVWKVKFVEVRRGMFSYYEDAVSGDKASGSLLRKNIPLDFNSCSCRAVKIHRKGLNITPGGAIFELKVGNSRRLWWAKSRDERQAWIQAINDAMVGGSVTQGSVKEHHGRFGFVNSKSPYKKDLKRFLRLKNALKNSKTKLEYVPALREILGQSLDVPVQWIKEQVEVPTASMGGAFYEGAVASGVEQLWKDLKRDTIRINGELFVGDSGHAPEKIIGALARNIVSCSRSSSAKNAVPESQAFVYARDVLLSTNRTRSGGDSYFCVDTMCNNPGLVVTIPSSREADPLSVSVELDESDGSSGYSLNDKTGWIRTHNRLQKNWRKRFFVLSEGTLSFYRNATPRPHGLRGQMVVTDSMISIDRSKENPNHFILSIVTKDGLKDRYLHFNNEDKLLAWAYALECTAQEFASPATQGLFRKRGSPRDLSKPHDLKPQEIAVEMSTKDQVEQSMKDHVKKLELPIDDVDDRIARLSANRSSTVKISVQATTEYKICTTDPQGDESDNWATINATFLQSFSINGGRIVRGEEIVRVNVLECRDVVNDSLVFSSTEDAPMSPVKSDRRPLGLRVRTRTDT